MDFFLKQKSCRVICRREDSDFSGGAGCVRCDDFDLRDAGRLHLARTHPDRQPLAAQPEVIQAV